ncbi:sensor histidine kinase [Hyphococcus lacteus]|uniref:histidine kinase n=1 Tax=Hyphococcus lacteus TaxID=3143536 RepID=A0ABV3Z7G3_9PROT
MNIDHMKAQITQQWRRFPDWGQTSATLLAVFIIAALVSFGLLTREAPLAPNDGVIKLPVEGFNGAFFGPYAEQLAEIDEALTVTEAASSVGWKPVESRYMNFEGPLRPIWLRTTIQNTSAETITVRFDSRRVAFNFMTFYLADENGENAHQFLDYSYRAPFSARPVNHRILVADVELAPQETRTAFVRFQGLYNSVLPLRLASVEAFERADKYEVFWSAMFYGTFCAIFVLTILTSPLIGWRLAASFGFFLIVSIVSVWSVEGYVDQLVIPDKNKYTARLTDTIYILNYIAILTLSRNLFNLRDQAPVLDRLLQASIAVFVIFVGYYFLIGIEARTVFVPFALTFRVLCLALHAAVGIWAISNRQKGGTIFTLSAVILTLASICMVVDETFGYPFGGVPFTLRWLVTIEATAFAIAIIQTVVEIKRQRDAGVQADLEATKEKLRLSVALRESQQAYDRAQRRAGQYQQKLETVSHDMLQPLASLKKAVGDNLQLDEASSKKMSDAFSYFEALARENVQHGTGGRDDHGRLHLPTVPPLTVSTIINNVVKMFEDEAASKGLQLRAVLSDQDETTDDPVLLMRAISNLVSNSIQYTDEGEVVIAVDFKDGRSIVTVRDTGPGIAPDMLETVKQSGVKGVQSVGSGLGLSIVEDAAQRLGAAFTMTSDIGAGTLASLQLPAKT